MTTTPVSRLDFFMDNDGSFLERIKLSLETHIKEVRKIAQDKQVLLVDHYKTWLQMDKLKGILKAYLPDGVHPNAEGNFWNIASAYISDGYYDHTRFYGRRGVVASLA